MKKLKTILQYRYTFKIFTLIIILLEILFLITYPKQSKYSQNETQITGILTAYKIDGNKLNIQIEGKEKVVANYYFKTKNEKEYYKNNLLLGDILKINGTLDPPYNNTVPNTFNYKKYLENKFIYFIMNISKIEIVNKNTNIFYEIKNIIMKRIDKIDKTGYLKTFIIGDKQNLDNETLISYQTNGISHLFAISGMHISLLVGILFFILDKITYNRYLKYTIIIIFLLFYLFLTGCSSSILRATIMFILFSINNCLNLKINKLDIVLITLDIILFINPYIIYDVGFQFSYLISFSLVFYNKKLSKITNKLKASLYTSILCFLVSFPICIYHFQQINFIGIFLNIIFIPFVSTILFPLCLLVFILPFLEPVLVIIIKYMELINNFISNITIFQVAFSKPNILLIIIYYFLIFATLYKNKYIKYLIIIMIIHKYIAYINPNIYVLTIDVSQGDSIFIKYPYNKANILIDTGGIVSFNEESWKERKKEYSIAQNNTIPYFKSLGISQLDILILTHGDYDHMGEAINLVNNFKVEKVIFNCGEFNDLEQELIKVLNKKKIPYYSCIKELNIDNNKLYFLNNDIYDNENDNSNVIYTKFNNYKFLFMGDAGIEVEEDILEKYNLKNIDVLKVGHHGSKTSSSKEFIDSINPKYSIISVGKNNRYNHPNNSVLKNLDDSKIYRTDQDGSVMFKINKDKLNIETYAP